MYNLIRLIVLVLFCSTSVFAGIVRVPQEQPSIQSGINAAANGDTVLVADSTYYENIDFKGKAITVASYFLVDSDSVHIDSTIINGSQPSHPDSGSVVFFVSGEDTTSILCGFTITGGTGTYDPFPARYGGGIACLNSGAKLIHNIIENNHIVFNSGLAIGGGIDGSELFGNTKWIILENNIIRGNTVKAAKGGGGGLSLSENAKVFENTIEHNTAESLQDYIWGGGIFLHSPFQTNYEWYINSNVIRCNKAISPTGTEPDGGIGGGLGVADGCKAIIMHNEIRNNAVESNISLNKECWGGGVVLQNQTDDLVFAENIILDNKALNNSICRGAGIAIWHYDKTGIPQLVKNIIANNMGGTYGGGLYIGGHVENSPSLINNTICDNHAVQGGAVYIGWNNQHVSHPEIENSILWNNSSSIYINTGDINVTYSDVEGGCPGEGNIDTDPLFHDSVIVSGDTVFYCLSANSPCIDAGNPSILCNDPEDPMNPGFALWPARGTLINDMGAYGGIMDNITGLFINDDSNSLASIYKLSQNYPNPFNPSTTIEFDLPKTSKVTLKIINILGEEVATLVSDRLTAGSYSYDWSRPAGIASGVYLYRLHTGDFVETRKMALIK